MEELLKKLLGKKVDVTCGSNAAVRGDVMSVENGLLQLRDEDEKIAHVAIAKIAVVYEVRESTVRPGFVN